MFHTQVAYIFLYIQYIHKIATLFKKRKKNNKIKAYFGGSPSPILAFDLALHFSK